MITLENLVSDLQMKHVDLVVGGTYYDPCSCSSSRSKRSKRSKHSRSSHGGCY